MINIFFIGSIYTSSSSAIRAIPLLYAGLTALVAGLMAGTVAAGTVDGPGSGTAVAANASFAVAITAVLIAPAAMGTGVRSAAATPSATDALVAIAQRAVPPSASAAERTVVINFSRAATAGTFPVGGNHAGEQDKSCQNRNK